MSSLLNPDAHNESNHEHAMSQSTAPATSDVTASLIKFWDTVRSSAELIVTLRQEVVQLRAQNATLESELAAAKSEVNRNASSQAVVEELEFKVLELTEQLEQKQITFDQEIAQRDDEAWRLKASVEEVETLLTDLSQARLELVEYELQVSAREAELRGVKDELATLQVQYEDLVESQSKATLSDLAALNEVHEKKLSEAQLEAAELRQTMERMKTEKSQLNDDYLMLAEKYQSIEVQVVNLQRALSDAQDALQQAHVQPTSADAAMQPQTSHLELDALRHRLSELELLASKAAETEQQMSALQEEIEALQEQLEKAMGIVELYRAAGLRHIEDPDLRNQMSLFGMPIASEDSRQIIHEQGSGKGLSPEEMEALADRLDNLASRVAHLLGIS
jgi:chromosome segregation ATPase